MSYMGHVTFLQLIAAQKTMLFCSKPTKLIPSHASRNNFKFGALSLLVNSDVTRLILRQLSDNFAERFTIIKDQIGQILNVQYLSKAMLDYSETSENVYLAFNQHIGLKKKKKRNFLVHLTFNGIECCTN